MKKIKKQIIKDLTNEDLLRAYMMEFRHKKPLVDSDDLILIRTELLLRMEKGI